MSKEEIEKIELERDFYNIMTSYGKLGYKINKTIDELNEISELSNLMAKEEKELKDRIQKAIEYIWSTKYEWGDLEEDNEDFDIDVYKLLDILKGSDKDIPGFEGTLEALDNLSIRGNDE